MAQIEDHAEWAKEDREKNVRERSREIEAATTPRIESGNAFHQIQMIKAQVNESMELISDRLVELETEIARLRQLQQPQYDGSLTENDILKVVGVILANDKLAEFLGSKIRDKFRDKVKVNFEIS